jgi:hypothetical protein
MISELEMVTWSSVNSKWCIQFHVLIFLYIFLPSFYIFHLCIYCASLVMHCLTPWFVGLSYLYKFPKYLLIINLVCIYFLIYLKSICCSTLQKAFFIIHNWKCVSKLNSLLFHIESWICLGYSFSESILVFKEMFLLIFLICDLGFWAIVCDMYSTNWFLCTFSCVLSPFLNVCMVILFFHSFGIYMYLCICCWRKLIICPRIYQLWIYIFSHWFSISCPF